MTKATVAVGLRLSDVDQNGHINNAAFLTILEDVRVRALHPIIAAAVADERQRATFLDGKPRTVVAKHEIEYVRQLAYSVDPVEVDIWIPRVGESSFVVNYQVWSGEGDEKIVHLRAASVIVYLDPESRQPRRVNEAERAAFAVLADEPIRFRGIA